MSAAIHQEARVRFPFGQVEHKAWAKRIMFRLEAGDKTLLMIQIQFAKQALDIKESA